MEGDGVELGEDGHAENAGIDAVGDRNIDKAILASNRYCRFGALAGERVKARAPAPAQDHTQDVIHGRQGRHGNLQAKRNGL